MCISRKEISSCLSELLLESCNKSVMREINCVDCEFDRYMFLVTNNWQGFDILLTVLNQINIYDSSSNHKKSVHHRRRIAGKNVS